MNDRPSASALMDLAAHAPTADLVRIAGSSRDRGHGDIVTYSPKVFLPLTRLCRDHCHYCTFAVTPRAAAPAYLAEDELLQICRDGAAMGCREALFTLGDKPELRYRAARDTLAAMGHASTVAYVAAAARRVIDETGLLPHVNAGVMGRADLLALRGVSASQGLMLETTSRALGERGGAHFGSPDKNPRARIAMLKAAGELKIPMTSGLLVGIGETVADRVRTLLVLRGLHDRHGHIQEVIVQNFRAKPGTVMARAPEPDTETFLRTVALARIALGPRMNIQAPPNLSPDALPDLIAAGINDWGGVSPLTPDHVNPEAPWPAVDALAQATARAGKVLVPRLTIYPAYVRDGERWL
ncbi:MAG: 7,8-didemethyl-8-hydroxy-5-deazariboflavin synthase CofG, partial [Sphingomonadales bacterium]